MPEKTEARASELTPTVSSKRVPKLSTCWPSAAAIAPAALGAAAEASAAAAPSAERATAVQVAAWAPSHSWAHYATTLTVIRCVDDSDVQNHGKYHFTGMNLLLKEVLNSSDPGQYIRQGAS